MLQHQNENKKKELWVSYKAFTRKLKFLISKKLKLYYETDMTVFSLRRHDFPVLS